MLSFQYFDGCPNAEKTLQNLKSVVAELGLPENEIEMVNVAGPEDAESSRFAGSPSILVDEVDIYTGKEPAQTSFSCRVFTFRGEQTGVIPKWLLRQKLGSVTEGGD